MKGPGDAVVEGAAGLSRCGSYRYWLQRRWGDGAQCCFIGLNPSTADAERDDPTLRRCMQFADDWGFEGVYIVNLFAFRATDPRELLSAAQPLGPGNTYWLKRITGCSALVVAAWGNGGSLNGRDRWARANLGELWCLGCNLTGQPRHPLYVPRNTRPSRFSDQTAID